MTNQYGGNINKHNMMLQVFELADTSINDQSMDTMFNKSG